MAEEGQGYPSILWVVLQPDRMQSLDPLDEDTRYYLPCFQDREEALDRAGGNDDLVLPLVLDEEYGMGGGE